jgi:hypothetical protein
MKRRYFVRAVVAYAAAPAMLASYACSAENRGPTSPSPVGTPPPAPINATGCSVSGVVHESPTGAISVGATVKIVKEPGGYSAPAIVSGRTDATGGYRLDGIDCGVSRLLRVEKSDFFSQEMSVLIASDVRRDLTIERITYPLRGIVRDASTATVVRDAIVEVISGPYAGLRTTTFTDGSYRVSVRDTVTVRVSKHGYVSQEVVVTVTFPESYRDFSLTPAA